VSLLLFRFEAARVAHPAHPAGVGVSDQLKPDDDSKPSHHRLTIEALGDPG